MSTHMSVNISIKEEAYEFLRSLKTEDKSFSDVILDFKQFRQQRKGSKENVLKFFGVLKNKKIDWESREKIMKEFREEFGERLP